MQPLKKVNSISKSTFSSEQAQIIRKLRKIILIFLISSSAGLSFVYFVFGNAIAGVTLQIDYVIYYEFYLTIVIIFSILLGIATSMLISFIAYRIIKRKRLDLLAQAHTFKDLLKDQEKVEIEELRRYFNFDSKTFYNRIIEWAEKFNITIDGEYLLMDVELVEGFIDDLDKQYKKWGRMEEKKVDKID
jgi:MFS superfamily sulfate permease-like transporter